MSLGNVSGTASSVRVNGAITTLTASQWLGGSIGAGSIGTLTTGRGVITGDFSAAVTLSGPATTVTIGHDMLGDWSSSSIGALTVKHDMNGADLTLTQVPDPSLKTWALGTLNVTGSMSHSWIRSAGNINSVITTKLLDSAIYAGVAATHDDLPAPGGDGVFDLFDPTQPVGDTFNLGAYIRTVTVKGLRDGSTAVKNSNIAAHSLGTISMVNGQFDNSGVPFGLAANALAKFVYSSATLNYTWPNSNPSDTGFPHLPTGFGNFVIRLF
jgi:hypothetical protein